MLCLQILATGDADPVMPSSSSELLATMVEAHRLGFPDVLSAAEQELGRVLAASNLGSEEIEAISCAAQLYDLEKLAREAATKLNPGNTNDVAVA